MTYQNQRLDFEFYLTNDGDKFRDGSTVKKLYEPRSVANIRSFGGHNSGEGQFIIWGLSFDDIATLTRFQGWNGATQFNRIVVKANGNTVYQGTIVSCVADLNQAPDVSVAINCQPCAFLMTYVAKPFSFSGEIKVAEVIGAIIKPFNMSLTNIDVTESVKDPYIVGSPFQQIMQIIDHVGCFVNYSYDDIYISKSMTPKDDKEIYLAPETGLIGYPMYYESMLSAKSYFNPSYTMGRKIKLNTILPLANGLYTIVGIIHDLSCNLPGGKFETNLVLQRSFKNEKPNQS